MNNSYFYAETAFHHQGDKSYLLRLIDAAAESGCDGIKFQVLTKCSDFMSIYHSSYEQINSYCFKKETWDELFSYAAKKDLDIILMPLNIDALDLVDRHVIKYLDIHSVTFNDWRLLEKINELSLDIILSVGGRRNAEIESLIHFFKGKVKVLMTGFQSFPTNIEKVKLGKIKWLKDHYNDHLIGYADHSSPKDIFAIKSNEYARILGATVFEKHITVFEGNDRVDSSSAVSSQKFKTLIENINFIEEYIISGYQDFDDLNAEEIAYRNRQLKCVAAINLYYNTTIEKKHISLKMVDSSEGTSEPEDLIGGKTRKEIKKDEIITVA